MPQLSLASTSSLPAIWWWCSTDVEHPGLPYLPLMLTLNSTTSHLCFCIRRWLISTQCQSCGQIMGRFTPSHQSRWSQQYWRRSCHDFPSSVTHEGIVHTGATLPCGSSDEPVLKRVIVHELWAPASFWAYTCHMALTDMLSAYFVFHFQCQCFDWMVYCTWWRSLQVPMGVSVIQNVLFCRRLYEPMPPFNINRTSFHRV